MRIFDESMPSGANIGFKSIVIVILVGLLQTYACSAFCSVSLKSCCNETIETHSCCSKEAESTSSTASPNGDCQEQHLAFSLSIGQFFSTTTIEIVKASPIEFNLVAINQAHIDFNNFETILGFLIYSGFSPPPPKQGIPVLISSILI